MAAAVKGERRTCHRVIEVALSSGAEIIDIYEKVFYPVMVEVGALWQKNEINVAQEHLITAITQNIISAIYPRLLESLIIERKGNALVACPGNELHELGARMLSDLWEIEGWNVTYLGSNIPADFIVETIKNEDFQVLGLSCSLSFNLRFVKEAVEKVRANNKFKGKIMVGGRIFNADPKLRDYVGADYHSHNYTSSLKVLNEEIAKKDDKSGV